MMKKLYYEAPEAELLEVKLERHFLASDPLDTNGSSFSESASTKDLNNPENAGIWNWLD